MAEGEAMGGDRRDFSISLGKCENVDFATLIVLLPPLTPSDLFSKAFFAATS
jgi:hypothetical protein